MGQYVTNYAKIELFTDDMHTVRLGRAGESILELKVHPLYTCQEYKTKEFTFNMDRHEFFSFIACVGNAMPDYGDERDAYGDGLITECDDGNTRVVVRRLPSGWMLDEKYLKHIQVQIYKRSHTRGAPHIQVDSFEWSSDECYNFIAHCFLIFR